MNTHGKTFEKSFVAPSEGEGRTFPRSFRLFTGLVCAGFAILMAATFFSPSAWAAGAEESATLPEFLFQPLFASNEGSVYGVYEARHTDLVLVKGGFNSGFRTGMVCRVADESGEVGELMLVDVRSNCAAAIILQLESGQVIEPGHSVRIKTVKF